MLQCKTHGLWGFIGTSAIICTFDSGMAYVTYNDFGIIGEAF